VIAKIGAVTAMGLRRLRRSRSTDHAPGTVGSPSTADPTAGIPARRQCASGGHRDSLEGRPQLTAIADKMEHEGMWKDLGQRSAWMRDKKLAMVALRIGFSF
jgi:hypothetical protein